MAATKTPAKTPTKTQPTFMGERRASLTKLLERVVRDGEDAVGVARAAGVGPHVALAMLAEAERRGLIAPDEDGRMALAPAGEALLQAATVKRMPREKAEEVLWAFLARCEAVNADASSPMRIKDVWLYGSMAGDAPDVGDIDLCFEWEFAPAYAAMDRGEALERAREYASKRMPKSAWATPMQWVFLTGRYIERQLYGERRHPLLKKQGDVTALKAMGCPCRLVFSSAHGGRFTGPLLPRHPESLGRERGMLPKVRAPDLSAPLDAPTVPVSFDGLLGLGVMTDDFRLAAQLPGRRDNIRVGLTGLRAATADGTIDPSTVQRLLNGCGIGYGDRKRLQVRGVVETGTLPDRSPKLIDRPLNSGVVETSSSAQTA